MILQRGRDSNQEQKLRTSLDPELTHHLLTPPAWLVTFSAYYIKTGALYIHKDKTSLNNEQAGMQKCGDELNHAFYQWEKTELMARVEEPYWRFDHITSAGISLQCWGNYTPTRMPAPGCDVELGPSLPGQGDDPMTTIKLIIGGGGEFSQLPWI